LTGRDLAGIAATLALSPTKVLWLALCLPLQVLQAEGIDVETHALEAAAQVSTGRMGRSASARVALRNPPAKASWTDLCRATMNLGGDWRLVLRSISS
jgi:hypothetical protein